jgi:hypothetical protein
MSIDHDFCALSKPRLYLSNACACTHKRKEKKRKKERKKEKENDRCTS